MQVLYLTGKTPAPANSGDALRNLALLRAARSVATRLDLVTLPQSPGAGVAEGLAGIEAMCDTVRVVGAPIGELLGRPGARLRTVLGAPYYHAAGGAAPVRAAVRDMIATTSYDVVVLGQLYLASALPTEVLARTVYDTHNVHHLRLRESLARTRLLPDRVRERIVAQVHDQEAELMGRVAVTVACSAVDAAGFTAMRPDARVEVIANGIDVPPRPTHTGAAGRPLFLASLDATANIEGLAHLVDDVLPHLSGDVLVDVAGSNARPVVATIVGRGRDRLRYRGQVPDARATMDDATALLVPLRTGGGTRLKVLEAFSVGLPVVSTPKGVEGIPVEHGRHALIAEEPREFAAAIERLHTEPELGPQLARHARALVGRDYAWTGLADRFAGLVADVAARPAVPHAER
ncbi:MAG: glycosyltransferase family 4 protein [Pseudonocardia sp.]